jgi:SPP1 family predicted phage head-tail adaptor
MIGEKRERVQIQEAIETADAEGQPVKNWIKYVDTWAEVMPLTGREYESMKQINSEISKRFVINYRRDVTVKMRIYWQTEQWNIHDIQSTADKFDIRLYASRVK